MPTNFYWYFIVALVPMLVGSLYYGPIMGKQWLQVNGYKAEDMNDGRLPRILIFCYLLSILMSMVLQSLVIHQTGVASMLLNGDGAFGPVEAELMNSLMATYGESYRSFGHGVLHGVMTALFLAWPIIAINAMFERRGWKYVAIHVGYWVVTLGIMGGLLCQFLQWAPLS